MVSQDEARFPLVPTLPTTLGVKGHRPVVGTWDNKDLVYSFAAMNVVTGQLTTRLLESPSKATARTGRSKTARRQQAFLAQLHDIARAYPTTLGKPVILTIDNAPWHQATGLAQVLAAYPQLQLYRLPSSSPQLNLIERRWRVLGRRATHKVIHHNDGAADSPASQLLLLFDNAPPGVVLDSQSAEGKRSKINRRVNERAKVRRIDPDDGRHHQTFAQ